jgi:hypothetical protein
MESPTLAPNAELIRDAMSRISQYDPDRLNEISGIVQDVTGYSPFSHRYAIAVLVLDWMERK